MLELYFLCPKAVKKRAIEYEKIVAKSRIYC